MKYILIVQGEGNGHLTQAISVYQKLIENNNDVHVYVSNHSLPSFFTSTVRNIKTFNSFRFYFDENGISIIKTLLNNFINIRKILKDYFNISSEIKKLKPNKIINFYDVLGSFLPSNNKISVAHQYKFLTPEYKFRKNGLNKFLLKAFTKLTSLNSDKIYALSWYKYETKHKKVNIIPPILRKELYNSETISHQPFILCYVNNDIYFKQIINWSVRKDKKIILYNKNKEGIFDNVTAKKLSSDFLNDMRNCEAFVSTAGFESISEALLFNKPVFVVPIKKQYEQECNSYDLYINKLGNYDKSIDEIEFVKQYDVSEWIKSGKKFKF